MGFFYTRQEPRKSIVVSKGNVDVVETRDYDNECLQKRAKKVGGCVLSIYINKNYTLDIVIITINKLMHYRPEKNHYTN